MNGIFCGNGTLLIQCAEAFLQRGGVCGGIITDDARIAAWADRNAIPMLGTTVSPDTGEVEFDWLFSIANLTVLSEGLIGSVRRGAINFHDGPLPAYAGLNVPAWAILAGETGHAVTWHEMTTGVDAGRVLKTQQVKIRPDETALSLNAKCYEAGLQSFQVLLEEIFEDTLKPAPQQGTRGWYGRNKRPGTLGVLLFDNPAKDLSAQVRALDFGTYENPLTVAKLWTGSKLLRVGKLEIGAAVTVPAGQITGLGKGQLSVAAVDFEVTLSDLTDMEGNLVESDLHGLSVGQLLPPVPALDAETLKAVGRDEATWQKMLLAASPALPPYPESGGAGIGAVSVGLDLPEMAPDQLAAGYFAWISGLTGQVSVTLAMRLAAQSPCLSDVRPMTLTVDAAHTPAYLTDMFTQMRAETEARAPMAADLTLRMADQAARTRSLQALSVVVADGGPDANALGQGKLALVTDQPRIIARAGAFAPDVLNAIAAHLSAYLKKFHAAPEAALAELPLSETDGPARTGDPFDHDMTIHSAIAGQVALTPDAVALEAGSVALSYRELDTRAEALAAALAAKGAKPGAIVGLCLERSADMVVAMLAILKTGAAYLPLDPEYPADRIGFMIEDAATRLIVASAAVEARLGLDPSITVAPSATDAQPWQAAGDPDDLAYLIYTSGSTGTPKGVMVPHRAVLNFFSGMDEVVPLQAGARFLSVTSVSFDISVLEIFWTLARGATLVLQTDPAGAGTLPGFSLFYFASEATGSGHHAYRLLLEGAKFADENGFEAIWTPERHFHAFGGLYPNPAISAAMLAGLTKNVKLRSGSAVVPLHHPIRVAEDWALVDNLSNGRAGIAIASGWQPNDFVVAPDAWENRKDIMLDNIDTLRALWRGDAMQFPGHDGKPVDVEIHPKPMQPEMPLWLTAAGNPETFLAAAKKGCGVLTHLLGQTVEEVGEKIRAYRVAWREAGHPGTGTVTLMLHTFVGEDEETVRETAREPMKGYLKSAVDLVKRASWTFPTIVERASATGMSPAEMFEQEELSAEDLDQLLDHAFERYYMTSGLFGTPESAKDIVRRLAEIGVDEIGCLIDFGIDTDVALANLPNIRKLMDALEAEGGVGRKASVAEEIVEHDITHLQCTPSMASFLAADAPGRTALAKLDVLMVGGEAFAPDLAQSIRNAMTGTLLNMYGPTETTIWSTVARLDKVNDIVPLGAPITNTALSVRSATGLALPDLVAGELWIGGEGVTQGYWQRPELTAERFVETDGGLFYRTGDQVRRHPDGMQEFLGRIDEQVKIRGHRIEPGEIESLLRSEISVSEAVVTALEFGEGDVRLVGYVTSAAAKADTDALLTSLSTTLPDVMIPSQIVLLDSMPLTPNGKIDRKALPHPTSATSVSGAVEQAEGEMESVISEIWRDALGLDEISVTDNFFDLGGHSLLVVQVQRRLKEKLGRDVAITDVFRFSTIRKLAGFLSGENEKAPSAASRGAARAAARLARMGRQ